MKRAVAVTIAALGILSLGAALAGAAAAAPPAWHYCGKPAVRNTGHYTDKACSMTSATSEGRDELYEGIGKGKAFKGKTTVPTSIIVNVPQVGELEVVCQKSSISGQPTAPWGVTGATLAFSKCLWLKTYPCSVTSEAMRGDIGWLANKQEQAGMSLTSEAEPGSGVFAHIECTVPGGSLKVRIRGGFIGVVEQTGTAVTKEHMLDYRVGTYLEETAEHTNPRVNPPEFEEEPVGVMLAEVNDPETKGEWEPSEGGYYAGIEGEFPLKGEALSIF
jgi:hypothetical protein